MKRFLGLVEVVRANLLTALAVVLIAATGTGYFLFITSSIGPGLKQRDTLVSQVASARQSLVDAGKLNEQNPADLQAKLASQQAAVTASQSMLLTDSQASQLAADLYRYADAAGVTITDLQTQPLVAQSNQNAYNALSIKLKAAGDSHQLVVFASQIKQAALQGFVVNNISLAQDKATSKLSLDASVFSSTEPRVASAPTAPHAMGQEAPASLAVAAPTPRVSSAPAQQQPSVMSAPTPAPPTLRRAPVTATPVRPTAPPTTPAPPTASPAPPTPIPQASVYVVRAGDTLFALARRFGTTVEAIMGANSLASDQIRVGQQLVIPVQ